MAVGGSVSDSECSLGKQQQAPLCHRTHMGALCTEQETRADLSSSPGTSRGHAGRALKAADSEGGWQHEVLLTGSLHIPKAKGWADGSKEQDRPP